MPTFQRGSCLNPILKFQFTFHHFQVTHLFYDKTQMFSGVYVHTWSLQPDEMLIECIKQQITAVDYLLLQHYFLQATCSKYRMSRFEMITFKYTFGIR